MMVVGIMVVVMTVVVTMAETRSWGCYDDTYTMHERTVTLAEKIDTVLT